MSSDDYGRATDIPPLRGTRLSPGRSIDRGELFALFRHCAEDDKKLRGVRDAAIMSLLYVCGMRRTEITELRVSDYDSDTLGVRVRGKGSKERMNYAEGGANSANNRATPVWSRGWQKTRYGDGHVLGVESQPTGKPYPGSSIQ